MVRIAALEPPFDPPVADVLRGMMPSGVPPIGLFRTFAWNLPMAEAMRGWGSYELSRDLALSMRDREIVIDRTCARCGCEYEWGVHVTFFAQRVKLSAAQVASLTIGNSDDHCWVDDRDRLLIRAVDALHDDADIPEKLWTELTSVFGEAELLDLTMLCGWYDAISFTARAARVAPEPGAARFADVAPTAIADTNTEVPN